MSRVVVRDLALVVTVDAEGEGAEAVFTALAVGSALVLIRSGTWLPDFRPVMP